MTPASALRWRCVLQQPVQALDPADGMPMQWQSVGSVWVEPVESSPIVDDNSYPNEAAAVRRRVRLRSGSGVKPGWRLQHGAQFLLVRVVTLDVAAGFDELGCTQLNITAT